MCAHFCVIHIECINDNFFLALAAIWLPHAVLGKNNCFLCEILMACECLHWCRSRLFDKFPCLYICRLPVPWLLYGIIYGEPVEVSSEGMVCSITILFLMLLFVIISIACFRWKMNKGLGLIMFLLYFVFVAISLTFEYEWYKCPL